MKKAYTRYNDSQYDYATKGEISRSDVTSSFGVLDMLYKDILPTSKEAKILDIGCGFGKHVLWLQNKGFEHTKGVDNSQSQTDLAEKLGISNVKKADAFEFLTHSDDTYDLILGLDIIEHMTSEELIELLTTIRARLNPNGVVVLQHPNPEGIFFESIYYSDITHKTAYTYKGIYQVAKLAGFDHCNTQALRPVPLGIKGVLRHFLWRGFEICRGMLHRIERGYASKLYTSNILTVLRK